MTDKSGFIKGIILGALFSILKTLLLNNTLKKSLDMPSHKAQLYCISHYYLRLVLTGAVMIVAILEPSINIWGTLAGILTFTIAAYIVAFWVTKLLQ